MSTALGSARGRTRSTTAILGGLLISFVGCGSAGMGGAGGGGAPGTGGTTNASGGSPGSGGRSSGSGGSTGTGGSSSGGALGSGGSASGGSATGSGGSASGGSATGSGGSASGGSSPGSGGSASGGSATGGRAATGGASGRGGGGSGSGGASSGGAGGGTSSGGAGGGVASGCLMFGTPTQVGTIMGATVMAGPSGMVASRAHPGVLYAQMDAGGPSTVFALTVSGTALGQYALMGVTQVDWEDIAVGPGPTAGSFIYVGDFGDNSINRTAIQVYRFAEPNVSPTQAAVMQTVTDVQVLRFTYPDGAHNAEALMVDPVTGAIMIVTKETSGISVVFTAPGNTPVNTPTVLTRETTIQFQGSGTAIQVGAGDISPTGDRVLLRTYNSIRLWARAATWTATFAATPITLPSPTEPQSEGLTFTADGRAWLSAGEQAAAIYQANATCP